MKLRITATVISDLEGSQAWQDPEGEHPDDVSLMQKVKDASARKDGSVTVDLTAAELEALSLRAASLIDKSKDGVAWGDKNALGDYNAGRALARQIQEAR